MKRLMSELLFDRPFNPSDKSNQCNPHLFSEVEEFRTDLTVLSRVKTLRQCFLGQMDCVCHGDFSCDNVLVWQDEFRVSSVLYTYITNHT